MPTQQPHKAPPRISPPKHPASSTAPSHAYACIPKHLRRLLTELVGDISPPRARLLLAECVGDMKAARAWLAAAVPPPALRLLPGMGSGAGLRRGMPRLHIMLPVEGQVGGRAGAGTGWWCEARAQRGGVRQQHVPLDAVTAAACRCTAPEGTACSGVANPKTAPVKACRTASPGGSPSSLPIVAISSCCWGGIALMAFTLSLLMPMPPERGGLRKRRKKSERQ